MTGGEGGGGGGGGRGRDDQVGIFDGLTKVDNKDSYYTSTVGGWYL